MMTEQEIKDSHMNGAVEVARVQLSLMREILASDDEVALARLAVQWSECACRLGRCPYEEYLLKSPSLNRRLFPEYALRYVRWAYKNHLAPDREVRQDERSDMIEVCDHVCPTCGKRVESHKAWHVGRNQVCCVACWAKRRGKKLGPERSGPQGDVVTCPRCGLTKPRARFLVSAGVCHKCAARGRAKDQKHA